MYNQDKKIKISLNPSYHCNFRCSFCYLTEAQLSDRTRLALHRLEEMLVEIKNAGYTLDHVDLYGGEVLLLPVAYLEMLRDIMMDAGAKDVEIITNLSTYVPEIVEDRGFGITVSYDFEQRPQHEHVWKNILKMNRKFTILSLGIPELLKRDPVEIIEQLNLLSNCKAWGIKPYSTNQANQIDVPYTNYEEFVKKIIEYPNKNFMFLNEMDLSEVKGGVANSFSDDHVYITPSGKFGVLEFDDYDNEFFMELPTFNDYLGWTLTERSRVLSNEFCGTCQFSGKCNSEHLREVKSLDKSCNGFHNLIQWYVARPES